MLPKLLPLFLLLLLGAAPAAPAAVETPVGDVPVLALEEEEAEAEAAAEDGGEEEECEELEEGFEECEEAEAASERHGPEECVLRSARAHGHLAQQGKKLKLTIGYTAFEPVQAKIEVGGIGTLQRHLGRSGVLRITKQLGARPGNRLVVRIEIPSARNAGCPFRRFVLSPH